MGNVGIIQIRKTPILFVRFFVCYKHSVFFYCEKTVSVEVLAAAATELQQLPVIAALDSYRVVQLFLPGSFVY